jgi:hypothetical protein
VTWTYDPTTDLGKCRLLCSDTDSTRQIMSDEDLAAFIVMAGHYMPAAAMALDSIAANEVLSLKVLNIMGMSTDGASVAKMLMARAQKIRDDYMRYSAANGPGFATAEMPDGTFSWDEKILKEYMRGHL